MKKSIAKALLPIALSCCYTAASGQLIINEIMQSNIDCIKDDLNEFPDSWVELYNPGATPENLGSYTISDKDKPEKAYMLPSRTVAPGGYVVIYCDKVGQGMHTGFRLDSGKGGAVYLFRDGVVADKIENWKKQPAPNIAYGRKTDGADSWGYQAEPTPGKANCGKVCKDVLGDPVFSVEGSVSNTAVNLTLSLPDGAPAGTVIRYTTDGKEPTAASSLYISPLRISNTMVVRAKLFCDGYLSPRSLTHSYIHHPRSLTLPLVSIVTQDSYFYDDKEGIYVQGTYTNGTPNYEYDWRRPINFEYFEGEGKASSINQLCETRVKGGATRGNPLKSLAVYANKRFGTKRFTYEFFPDQTPGINDFKSFEMRNSGNDFDYLYFRDAVIQQCMGMNADLDWQPSRPVIVYINGVYKGILNIRPRSNEDFVYSYYDGLEDVDVIENWEEVKEGSIDNLNAFMQFYAGQHTYAEYEQWMDVGEFCNYMLVNIFFDNKDFPGNNLVLWRPTADDGKWRWICKDTDFGLGLYGERVKYPTLNWITTPGYDNNRNDWANTYDATRLLRRLLNVPEFKDMFIDRAAVYMGDFLRPEIINDRIEKRYAEIKDEYTYHRNQFNPWWPNYAQEVANAKTWATQRQPFFYDHLTSFFGLSRAIPLTIDKGAGDGRTLVVNDIPLKANEFDGKYFPGRSLKVKSLANGDGLYVVGWEVKVTNGSSTQTQTYETENLAIEMPSGTKVEIKTRLSSVPLSITDVTADIDPDRACEVYDVAGRFVGTASPSALRDIVAPGVYILRQGAATGKVIVK